MERIEIRLKECCLECEHFYPDGLAGFGYGCYEGKRFIGCLHSAVCMEYITSGETVKVGEHEKEKSK